MKFKSLFAAAIAAVAVLVGCQGKEEPVEEAKLSVSPQTLSFEATAGEKTVQLTSTREWKAQIKYEGDVKDWLSVSPESGSACPNGQNVTITAKANEGKDRKATVTFTIGLFKSSLEVSQVGEDGPDPVNDGSKEHPFKASEASAKAATLESGAEDGPYYVKGYVKKFATKHEDGIKSFGNALFYITDDTSGEGDDFYCYQVYYLGGKKFTSTDQIKLGDEVIVYGKITNYNGTYETVGKGAAFIYSLNGKTEGGDDPDPVEPITGENLLTNGGFETWTAAKPEAWDFTNGNATLTKVGSAKEGSNACEVAGDANSNKRLMSKEYNLKPGTYQIQVYVKGEGQYRLGYAKLTNHAVSSSEDYKYINDATQATSDWTLQFVEFKITEQTAVSITIMNSKYGNGKSVIVDDVRLVTQDGGLAPDVPVTVVDATVTEILADPSSDVVYRLTGTVSSFNSEYCSFDLTDATGTIYVYSVDEATKKEYASKVKDGDTVTIEGTYYYYEKDQKHEIVNAKITDWKQGEQPGPGPEVLETESVAEVIAATDGTSVKLSNALVVAAAKTGYLVTDAQKSAYLFVFKGNQTTETAPEVGDVVTVEAKKSTYQNFAQLSEPATTVISSGSTVTYPSAEDISSTFDSFSSQTVKYVSFTGKLSISDYYNVNVPGASKNIGSLISPKMDLSAYKDVDNIRYEGYFVYVSGGKYINIVLTKAEPSEGKFFSVNPLSRAIAAAATTVDITVSSNVAWSASSDTDGFTLDKASGEGNGTIKVTCPENISEDARTVKITVSTEADVTTKSYEVIITQSGVSSQGSPITLTFPDDNKDSNKISSYTDTWTAKTGAQEFTITGFNNNSWKNDWSFIKCGRKNNASTATIVTNVSFAVKTFVVTVDACTSDKVNAFKLEVASDAAFANDVQTVTLTIAKGDNTFTIPSPVANAHYRLTVDCASGSSNGLVTVSKLVISDK